MSYIDKLCDSNQIYQEIDGMYVLAFEGGTCLYSYHLREIADALDAKNEDWQNYITETLTKINK